MIKISLFRNNNKSKEKILHAYFLPLFYRYRFKMDIYLVIYLQFYFTLLMQIFKKKKKKVFTNKLLIDPEIFIVKNILIKSFFKDQKNNLGAKQLLINKYGFNLIIVFAITLFITLFK